MPTDNGPHCGLVLFGSMPDGAGHVAELLESASDWIGKLTDVLFVGEAHHERCVSACLDCLLSYETQFDHDQGLLASHHLEVLGLSPQSPGVVRQRVSRVAARAPVRLVRNRCFGTLSTGSLGTGATKAKVVGSPILYG